MLLDYIIYYDKMETKEELDKRIEKYSFLCSDYVKNNDLANAKIYRNKVIELYEIKKEIYTLDKEETQTLKTLKLLKNNENNNSFKRRLIKKINKTQ